MVRRLLLLLLCVAVMATACSIQVDDLPLDTVLPAEPPERMFGTADEVAAVVVPDIEAFWATELPRVYGIEFQPVRQAIPYRPSDPSTLPTCAGVETPAELAAENAFYCFADDIIAWDAELLLPRLFRDFGDFTVALVLAHEYGHAIQQRARSNGPTILVELQADCFAGAWAQRLSNGTTTTGQRIDDDDLEAAIGGYLDFRDPLGTVANDPGAHGTAFDRVSAFVRGLEGGVDACVDTITNPPTIVEIPLVPTDVNAGNLPLPELFPLLLPVLDEFWTQELAAQGATFTPPQLVQYNGQVDRPVCGGVPLADDIAVGNAFYCPAENTVLADGPGLLQVLFDTVGDFASAYVVTHAWSQAAVVQHPAAGYPTPDDPEAFTLAADCLSGVVASVLFAGVDTVRLSAGDLDEGIIGMLRYAPSTPAMEPVTMTGQPFDRVSAFTNGFFDGAATCA